jgi:hypothetical protein
VNLGYTTIVAPIDGIVISRNVDQGQTVASSMNAPTLYVIAADLTKMQVVANIDEADVGRMRPGQDVTFRVDAYPQETFRGTVQQVRLQPAVVQNVVTYSTVIAVPNPELKLKPGMTATVTIEVARRTNVLRIPAAALRFRPTEDMFQALNQELPAELRGGGRGGLGEGRGTRGGDRAGGAAPGAAAQPPAGQAPAQPPAQTGQPREPRAGSPESRGGGSTGAPQVGTPPSGGERRRGEGGGRGGLDPNLTPEERRKRMEERMASMTPEERERFQARMRERQAEGGGRGGSPQGWTGGSRGDSPQRREGRGTAAPAESRTMASGATTIDALFAPLEFRETPGRAWLYVNNQLKSVRLRLGISDGTYTEVLNESEFQPNQEVVISMTTGLEPRTTPGQGGSQNPLMGPQRGGRGPGGGGGGRGR